MYEDTRLKWQAREVLVVDQPDVNRSSHLLILTGLDLKKSRFLIEPALFSIPDIMLACLAGCSFFRDFSKEFSYFYDQRDR